MNIWSWIFVAMLALVFLCLAYNGWHVDLAVPVCLSLLFMSGAAGYVVGFGAKIFIVQVFGG